MKNSASTDTTDTTDMTGIAVLGEKHICFDKKIAGYDISQVDVYIKNLSEAYQSAYYEYRNKCAEYDNLYEEYKDLKEREKNRPGAELVGKTLLDVENLMHKLVEDARVSSKAILEKTYYEKFEVTLQAQKILDDAREEAAATKANAQKLLDEAYSSALKIECYAKRNIEQVNELISKTIGEMRHMTVADGGETVGAAPAQAAPHNVIPFDSVKKR